MYKKIILVISFVLVLIINLNGQNDIVLSLKKKKWKCNNNILDSILLKYPNRDSIYFRIPLSIWIYPNKKGFGPGYNEIKNMIRYVNYYYNKVNKTGIEFYLANIKIIHTNSKQEIGFIFENFFLTLINKIPGTINVHVVNKITYDWFLSKKELGGVYNNFTHSIIITRSDIETGLAHELGHYFGLLHPHRNWNKGKKKAEAVSRTMIIDKKGHRNCECKGDYLCDTPAEPDLSLFLDDSCRYIGNITDPWNQIYKPNTDNIMSYQQNKKCRKSFTKYQIAVFFLYIENSKYYRFWKTSKINISITPDKFEPDDFIQISTYLEPFVKQYHTFHLIYSARKLKQDNYDFFKYYPLNYKSYLKFSKGKYLFPRIKITMYDNFFKDIYTMYIDLPGIVKLPNVSSPVCYIKIENLYPIEFGTLYDYTIELQQFK